MYTAIDSAAKELNIDINSDSMANVLNQNAVPLKKFS
jgi:hypothetical protein